MTLSVTSRDDPEMYRVRAARSVWGGVWGCPVGPLPVLCARDTKTTLPLEWLVRLAVGHTSRNKITARLVQRSRLIPVLTQTPG